MADSSAGDGLKKKALNFQRNEITEHLVYRKLSQSVKGEHNRKVLRGISDDELEHYAFWKKYTGTDVKPSRLAVWKYYLISKLLGVTFGTKLMENGEKRAQASYDEVSKHLDSAKKIGMDEKKHERELIDMVDEEKLNYVGSVVLGLNDALVELTGALAGFTLAFQETSLIALAGLITGVAASLSMGASEYLSTKSEEEGKKSPLKSSIYTSIAYVFTVGFLIFPFFLLSDVYMALGLTIFNAVAVIFVFTFYVSVAKDLPFRRRFLEMATISIGVSALTFVIGFIIKMFLGIDV